MKRIRSEEYHEEDANQKANKRAKIDQSRRKNSDVTLPKDVWLEVLMYIHVNDVIFLRAVNSSFYKWCKELKPFPKYFVLDQDKYMEYLVENGFISLLDYVKNTLRFEWNDGLALVATRSGQVETLKHLFNNGLPINDDKFFYMLECTRGTCSLSMIKFLLERGLGRWDMGSLNYVTHYTNYKRGDMTVMEYMAYHGHLDCIKYAMENGCTERVINYTPSIECLDFAIQNGFEWREPRRSTDRTDITMSYINRNICEVASSIGDLTVLKYSHQKGAPLLKSAEFAANRGSLECLKYAMENAEDFDIFPTVAKTLPCFKYLESKFGQRFMNKLAGFMQIMYIDSDVLRYMLELGIPKPDHLHQRDVVRLCHTDDNFKLILDGWKMLDNSQPFTYKPLFDKNLIESVKLVIERNLLHIQDFEVEQYISGAISSNNVQMLELLWKILPRTNEVIENNHLELALNSTPEILDFLTKQGIKWTSEHFVIAAEQSSLTCMAYLMKQGCRWEDTTCSSPSNLCLKYAKEHGCTKTVKSDGSRFPEIDWN